MSFPAFRWILFTFNAFTMGGMLMSHRKNTPSSAIALGGATTPGVLRNLGLALAVATFFQAPMAEARITRIQVTSIQSPTFEGLSFGSVGPYEKIRGRAFGEVDSGNPQNTIIMDIGLAPRNQSGMIMYSMDFYILKPVQLAKGNHKLFYEVNNRGNKVFGGFNNSGGGNDPTTAEDAGGGFLMNRGYSIAWSGWDISATQGDNRLTITVPIATNPDGSSIVGPSFEEFVIDNSTTITRPLSYRPATLDKSQASLNVREHFSDPRTPIPESGWEYVDEVTIRLLPDGTAFQQGSIYEFTYVAKDPLVAALGLAATRDFVAFLRHAETDDLGTANPLAGDVQVAYGFGLSQSGRCLRDFLGLGFNEDENGQRVFDGINNYVSGAAGVNINFRFGQPARTERNRRDRFYPESFFPFANQVIFDPISAKTDGRLGRCLATDTCPKVFEINSANEYWVKAGSLLHMDTSGNDLPDPPNVRFYLLSTLQHGGDPTPCQQPQNPVSANPALRALFVSLDEWVTLGTRPPRSQVPKRSNGTAVPPLPQEALGFPNIPGVTYNGLFTTRYLLDFGPLFDQGILTNYPPPLEGPVYPAFVSRTDRDGNEVAGIRLPEIEVPLATYTGWGLRRAGFGENDGCEGMGQKIPFKNTRAERLAAGDPRRSIEERYHTHRRYVREVEQAARRLERQRLLLEEDVERYIKDAEASDVLR